MFYLRALSDSEMVYMCGIPLTSSYQDHYSITTWALGLSHIAISPCCLPLKPCFLPSFLLSYSFPSVSFPHFNSCKKLQKIGLYLDCICVYTYTPNSITPGSYCMGFPLRSIFFFARGRPFLASQIQGEARFSNCHSEEVKISCVRHHNWIFIIFY